MGPKKDNDSKVKRKMTRITIEAKKEIIAKHENGRQNVDKNKSHWTNFL
jgi:hypothetical protein